MVTSDTHVTMSTRAKARKETTIPAGEFKAKCLALLDEVDATGRTIVVTKRGRAVARVVPLSAPSGGASLLGTLLEEEDLLSPVDASWDACT